MRAPKIIYRVVAPIVGGEPMVCDLSEYRGQQFTRSIDVAREAFEACAKHCGVILQQSVQHSGVWIDLQSSGSAA